ncbi:hypothetical protein AB0F07_35945 [Streptomyces fructofermentans]|uniref:hypothetical protein n=1 Tax=Streptomyces fructofermentans TaxID=152141 RepID=UPI0033D91150
MTVTSGLEPGRPLARSRDAKDNALPQGLKSSPRMPNADYPHLGFDPVPGSTETVRGLHVRLTGCAKVLEETRDLVTRLMDGSYWKGDAAVAFREQLDGGSLPLNLKNAAHSLGRAARQLKLWEGELDEFQCRARRLEEEAKAAREAVGSARGRAATAGDDPDLEKKGAGGEDAQKALTRANTAVDEAGAELEKILGRARRLAEEHERQAEHRATRIREATRKLVPREPGCFDSALDWLSDNLPDILSFVAGVVGLVALFVVTGGVAAAVLLLAAAALSAGAFALRLSDPEVLATLQDGFAKGEFDSDFWGTAVGLGGDLMGALPGVGAVGLGIRGTAASIRTGGEVLSLGQKVATLGTKTMSEARAISSLENPALDLVVSGARDSAKAARVTEVSSASLGVATAGYGLVSSAVDSVDSDGVADGATGIDGTRSILDGGGLVDLSRYVF